MRGTRYKNVVTVIFPFLLTLTVIFPFLLTWEAKNPCWGIVVVPSFEVM
jgi:hypothetical protein